MGRKPNEDQLLEQGAAMLRELREEPIVVLLSDEERDALMDQLGNTEGNVDELLSLEEA